jgi:hypothetical protein
MGSLGSDLPLRLLCHDNGEFYVCDARSKGIVDYDILSYRWHSDDAHDVGVTGVSWNVKITDNKVKDIRRLMRTDDIQYLWVDCICINQEDLAEQSVEMSKMYEYYKNAKRCHILMDMDEVWNPQLIVDDLKFIDHILSYMDGAALASEARLTERMATELSAWANTKDWVFRMEETAVRSAAIEMGVLNCYATCISHISSLFDNEYFSRVWTFQEMLLGKNITMWGINEKDVSCVGALHTWMDLATDARDKAEKLEAWIEGCRVHNTASVNTILGIIQEDKVSLGYLQTQVRGINSARTDIISGGPRWWLDNHKGISNIFSAISMRPREATKPADIFKGLLGVFSGMFTAAEIESQLSGEDIEAISFAFFRQLSLKTGRAWTRLAISSRERGEWEWIPVAANHGSLKTTDCFSGVINLGRLKPGKGLAKTAAITGLIGAPRQYLTIKLLQGNKDFQFVFRGCNGGKKVKTGTFSSEPIPLNESPRVVSGDETGRTLVQCATILSSLLNPDGDIVDYRRRLLYKLAPTWKVTDANAKHSEWADRCVSGTSWEDPAPNHLRAHNHSMNYIMRDVTGCQSRLQSETTADMSCEVRINCGCTIVAPFSLVMEAIIAVDGSFLGDTAIDLDKDNRIVLQDGLGLVQVGDVGKSFHLVAFGGNVKAHPSYAAACRGTKESKPVIAKLPWPCGRALVRADFRHDSTSLMRDYGYVETGGSGNLLICRNNPIDDYKVVGVCIDEFIDNKKGYKDVVIG